MLTKLAASLWLLFTFATQDAGTLRIRVMLMDASGVATPVPRLVLLVSDNPPTDEPRRVRTGADGTAELKLAPGSYAVELDEPVAFRGKAYTWTQIVEVTGGRDTVLDLTAGNAEEAASARISADSATLLTAWRDSVVEIWTPTTHASGFVVDANGLIATSHRALAGHTSVEVEITGGGQRFKVPGRVILSEYDPGAAFVWVNAKALASARPIDLRCARQAWPEVAYQDVVTTVGASVLVPKEVSDGRVTKVTSQAIFSDMRLGSDSTGGPVFAESGELLGISSIDDPASLRRWNDAWVVPLERVCGLLPSAIGKMAGPAPADTRLPVDPLTVHAPRLAPQGAKPAKAAKVEPPVKASNFDITIFSPQQAREIEASATSMRTDFGTWSQYVRDAPPVVLVRVSPQFEEALWKLLARGYAALQGVWLNPFKSFTSNFLRMHAYCGDTEVLPIHPFIIEHRVPERSPIREGLYVFERGAFGPHCPTIRFSMFSEKDPQRADTKAIDPKLFEQFTKP